MSGFNLRAAKASSTPLVLPGDSNASRLLAIVTGRVPEMQDVDAHRLLPDDTRVLKASINAGANWPD